MTRFYKLIIVIVIVSSILASASFRSFKGLLTGVDLPDSLKFVLSLLGVALLSAVFAFVVIRMIRIFFSAWYKAMIEEMNRRSEPSNKQSV